MYTVSVRGLKPIWWARKASSASDISADKWRKSRNYQCKERTTICRIRLVVLNWGMTLPSREHLDIHGDVFDCHNLEVGCLASSAQRPRMLLGTCKVQGNSLPNKELFSGEKMRLASLVAQWERICMPMHRKLGFNPDPGRSHMSWST